MNVEIVHNAVTDAADEMTSASSQIASVKPETRLSAVGQALPGAASGGAATTCGTRWREDLDAWHRAAQEYAELMASCADAYQATDQAQQDRMDGMRPGTPY